MTAAEITLGAAVCVLWAVFLILSAIGTVVTHKDAKDIPDRAKITIIA